MRIRDRVGSLRHDRYLSRVNSAVPNSTAAHVHIRDHLEGCLAHKNITWIRGQPPSYDIQEGAFATA